MKIGENLDDLVYRIDTRPTKTYRLDITKIKTLDDVIRVLDGLNVQLTLKEGTTCEMYEKLKDYFY